MELVSYAGGVKSLLKKFQVALYLLVATLVIPFATFSLAMAVGAPKGSAVRLIGTTIIKYSPTLTAILIVAFLAGRTGLKQLLGRFLIWKVEFKWYLLVLLIPLLLDDVIPSLLSMFLNKGVDLKFNYTLASAYLFLPVFARYFFLGGGMGEEFGWRGYLTPHFQQKYSVLKSAVIIGVLWAVWHFPNYWMGSKSTLELFYLHIEKIARAVPMAIVYAWVFNNTRGSVLLAALMHAAVNAWGNFYSLEFQTEPTGFFSNDRILDLIAIAGWLSLALALVCKPGALTKKI